MSSWVTIRIEFIKTLAGPGKGRSRPRTDNSTAGGGLASGADVRPESQTSIKTKDSPNQQELGGLASGAESIVVRPESQTSIKTEDSPNQQKLEGLASGAESIVVRPGNQPSTKTEDTPNQQELERRRKIVRQFFNDFWRSADAKPVTFAERLNLAEGYINERLVACGEAWQLRCPEATRPASALASPNSKKVVALPNPAREQSQLAWLLKEQGERGAWADKRRTRER